MVDVAFPTRHAGAKEGCDGADSICCRIALQQRSDSATKRWRQDRNMPIVIPKKAKSSEPIEAAADLIYKTHPEENGLSCEAGDLVCEVQIPQPSTALAEPLFAETASGFVSTSFQELILKIGLLDQGDAICAVTQAVERLDSIKENNDQIYFELGGTLSKVKANGWFKGHERFDDFVRELAQMHPKKAHNLIKIYDAIVAAKVDWSNVQNPGWTKMRYIARIIDEKNSGYWLQLARDIGRRELEERVRAEVAKLKGQHASVKEPKQKKSYKFHADQYETEQAAIDKMKEQFGTKYDEVALEHICIDFMATEPLSKKVTYLSDERKIVLLRILSREIGRERAHDAVEGSFEVE